MTDSEIKTDDSNGVQADSSGQEDQTQRPLQGNQQIPEKEVAADSWPLEADRLAVHSPLIECLRILAGHYGRRTSENALTAGLPIPPTGITPSLFERAAQRADMTAKLTERTLEALAIAPNLPCILVLEHKQACILWEVRYPKGHAPKKSKGKNVEVHPETRLVLQFPETPDERKVVKLSELARIFTNYCFFARPVARVDDRAGPAEIDTARNWFWGTLKEHMPIYREVILGTIMINCFALASTLYIMNVYDRVIPNGAFETLWVLSIGALIVYGFDFFMKNMRSYFLDIAGRKADVKISTKLFEQVLGMTLAARPSSAGVLASNMREFETIRDFFTSATMAALIDLPFSMFFIIIIAVIAGPLAIIPLLAIPLVVGCGWILQKPMQRIIRQSMHESALKNALLFETITGLETIKTQAAEGHVQRRWEELTDKGSQTAVKSKRVAAFALNFSLFIQQFTVICMVIAGVYMIADANLSQGALVGSVLLVGRALGPLSQVAGLMTRFNQSIEALRQLEDLMRRPVERPAGKHLLPGTRTL